MTDQTSDGFAQTQERAGRAGEEEVNLIDLLIVLAKHKEMIVAIAAAGAIGSLIVSLLLPNVYTGYARIIPPQQSQSTAAMLLGQLGGIASLAGASLGVKNPADLYAGMLESRTVADAIIHRFDLQAVYEEETMVKAREALAARASIAVGKDGLITVAFDDEDPERAAAVANAYVEELTKLTQSLAVTEAAQRRLFFEQQLRQAKEDLATAEVALQQTQEKTGLIKLDDQGRAIIEAVATLRAQITAKEVELNSMRAYATELNPDYTRAQQQLAGLRRELGKLEGPQTSRDGTILLATGAIPEAGLEYLRKFRDVKYHEAMFEVLAKQFEAAKIDEANDAALVQVVDAAVPPDRKSKPKRALIVVVASVLAGFVGAGLAFVLETGHRARNDPLLAAQLATLRGYTALRRSTRRAAR